MWPDSPLFRGIQQRIIPQPKAGPTMDAWKARIPQDIEELNAPRKYKLPSQMSRDELVDMASDLAMPMAGVTKTVSNVALNASDDAARLARAKTLGYTDDVYHGTRSTRPIDEFRMQMGGQRHDLPGVHVGSLEAATQRLEKYFGGKDFGIKTGATNSGQAASIMPLKMRANKPFVKRTGDPYSEGEIRKMVTDFAKKNGIKPDARDAKIRFRDHLLAQGYDVIPYVNSVEDRGNISHLVLKPENLRSRFADFMDGSSPNIMAALLGSIGLNAYSGTEDSK